MYDLLIKNGQIIDGTGSPSYFADVAIKDGKIAKIGKGLADAKEIIDAKGLTITPGFIDSHSHSDARICDYPEMVEKIEQGITTSIGGQCGSSVATTNFPKDIALGSNNALLAGHGTIRKAVMGYSKECPTAEQLEEMKALLRKAMEDGAIGLSLGLIYAPGSYAKTEELVEMAKVVKEYEGVLAAHIRSEANLLVEAVEEFIHVAKTANVRGVISHHKACGAPTNWGKVKETLRMVDEANAEGYDIYVDVYPYTASSTSAAATFVPDYGRNLMERLASMEEREEMKKTLANSWWMKANDFSWVQIARCDAYPQYSGLFLPEIAKLHGKPEYETVLDLIYDSNNHCTGCYHTANEDDLKMVLAHPRAMVGTDSGLARKDSVFFHPRLKGTFPRVLGKYVREEKIISLPEAIRKMTSMAARVYNLSTKGLVWEGMDADLCIFDADRIIDHATFTDCFARAEGLNYVILSGEVVVEHAIHNGKKPGKVLTNV